METKSIGAFIAVLRRAKGLTQRQLAEMLHVSDKAVSRWERDECAPDLSLIPVIAELFGVTSDELLRGERITREIPETRYEALKTEKMLQRLLREASQSFQIHSILSLGIALIALAAALICNMGFLRAQIGFCVATVFIIIALVCQIIFTIVDLNKLTAEGFDAAAVASASGRMKHGTYLVISCILVIWAACLPLMTMVDDAYLGLSGDSWLVCGGLYALLAGAGLLIGNLFFAQKFLATNATLLMLRRRWFFRCLILCLATATLAWAVPKLIPQKLVAQGYTFDSFQDFKAYMETYVSPDYIDSDLTPIPTDPAPQEETREEPLPDSGNVPQEPDPEPGAFVWRNHEVVRIEYSDTEDKLPITVYTARQWNATYRLIGFIQILVLLLTLPETVFCYYCYRRQKTALT